MIINYSLRCTVLHPQDDRPASRAVPEGAGTSLFSGHRGFGSSAGGPPPPALGEGLSPETLAHHQSLMIHEACNRQLMGMQFCELLLACMPSSSVCCCHVVQQQLCSGAVAGSVGIDSNTCDVEPGCDGPVMSGLVSIQSFSASICCVTL
jgi:hypothetical protein